jgi:RHS repeat-associated protein
MANGPASSIISLPQGGGALQGIGEKFAPDLHTGTGNFIAPLALPAGRNGLEPKLDLVYSTGQGNGAFGCGWGLSVPGVDRKTSRGTPRYDERDVFMLSGAEDLVAVGQEGDGSVMLYRPRTEGLFARIVRHRAAAAGDDYWEVQSRDGLVSIYGTRGRAGADPAAVADPARHDHVFAWKLTETRDTFGNHVAYEYWRDTDADGRWGQLYLAQVRYADYVDEYGLTRFLVTVDFTYEPRPDVFSSCRSGFEIRTALRCTSIHVATHADRARPVREYRFAYDNDGYSGISLLRAIHIVGFGDDGAPAEEMPPLEFGYTRFEPGARRFVPLGGAELPTRSLASPELDLVDLFGNGLPDILEMNGAVRYWRNRGDGGFDAPRPMASAPSGIALGQPGVQLLDADGDGRTDLLVSRPGLSGFFPLQYGGFWDAHSFRAYATAPSFNLHDPEVRLLDLDGDGVTDALRSGSRLECFFNDPHQGWHESRQVERKALETFPNVSFSNPRVKLADMTGDGLQNIVLVGDGNLAYWPNLGRGDWGPRVHMENSPRLPYGFDPKYFLFGDVDGDGLADAVYVESGSVTLWINRGGRGWSDPVTIHGTPPVTDTDDVRLVDVLGSGISGVLWSTDAPGSSRRTLWFLDLTGGVKPYLLNEMDNHLGAVTRVEYAPSTRYLVSDASERRAWRTPLPFPVHVVSRVEVVDQVSGGKLTTEYRYHHGYWDGAEREFRGFGMVEQLDTESFEEYHGTGLHGRAAGFRPVERRHFSPPTRTRTWFHQGPVGENSGDWRELNYTLEYWAGDPPLLEDGEIQRFLATYPQTPESRRIKRDALRALRGSMLRTETYTLDGSAHEDRPWNVTEYAYGLREESPPGAGDEARPRIFFPYLRAQRTTEWERGDDPLTHFSFTDDYDVFGQPCRETGVAPPRRSEHRRPVTGAFVGTVMPDPTRLLAVHTRTEYATPEPGFYLHDRVAQEWTYEMEEPPEVAETVPHDLVMVLRDQTRAAWAAHRVFTGASPGALRLTAHSMRSYDGAAFSGLPVGQAGRYGALTRMTDLVMTDRELDEGLGDRRPSYLDGSAALPPGAPAGFGLQLGYRRVIGPDGARHYYADLERRCFDFQTVGPPSARGLVVAIRDALGNDTTIDFDAYRCLPVRVADPVGLTTEAAYDYRVFQPARMTDANGNVVEFRYSPLGLLSETWAMGNPSRTEGDRSHPGLTTRADFLAFAREGEPIYVHSTRRAFHDTDVDVPPDERDETIESREYSDGFGRLIQTRVQADSLLFGDSGDDVGLAGDPGFVTAPALGVRAADRVIVSGWQVYDNKGRVVESYNPFFDTGWGFRKDAARGRAVLFFRDPQGKVVRTLGPDGAEQRTVLGIPRDLANPDDFAPTPWEAYAYDANDLAPLSHRPDGTPLTDATPVAHHFTPTSTIVDALGRTICQVERNGPDPTADWYITCSTYDLRANLLTLTDPLNRVALRCAYELSGGPLRVSSIDAGVRTNVANALGELVEYRDGKGSMLLREYDAAGRLTRVWARDDDAVPLTLRERIEYGDEGDRATNRTLNRLGEPARRYDEAGLVQFERYDFRGNLLAHTRRAIADSVLIDSWTAAWDVPDPGAVLDAREYRVDVRVDAADRTRELLYPVDGSGHRARLVTRYGRAGALDRVELDGAVFVEHIAYNARGQRVLVAYGNGVVTRQRYDSLTCRLVRLHTQRCTRVGSDGYAPAAGLLQDLAYEYDLVGNIVSIRDRAPGCGVQGTVLGPDALDRRFTYDAVYRLRTATGRECDQPPDDPLWDDFPRCADLTRAYSYSETYDYDPAGNLTRLAHTQFSAAGVPRTYARSFAHVAGTNRLHSLTAAARSVDYEYDPGGNLVREATSRHHAWDHADRLKGFRVQAGAGPASVSARYLYDAEGHRVKRLVAKAALVESTVNVEGIFEHHRRGAAEHFLLHVMDEDRAVAVVRSGPAFPDDGAADMPVQYQLGDHLDSTQLVIGGATAADGSLVRREEHTPYGETSFGSFARKRYRFMGKERDEASGFYYFGARYYSPWLARWSSCDPAGITDDLNLYLFSQNNPVSLQDDDGAETVPPRGAKVHYFQQKHKEGEKVFEGYSKIIRWPGGEPTARQAGGDGTRGTGSHGSPGGTPGGPDAVNQPGTKGGTGHGLGGQEAGGTGSSNLGGTGPPGGGGGDPGGSTSPGAGEVGSASGPPTGSANSQGGSPNGTDDPNRHRSATGEGTGITGKGTGSLTQLDLAVLIARAVSDPTKAALDAATQPAATGGKSGGVPEGHNPDAAGNEAVQAAYLVAMAVKAAAAAAISAASAVAKSGGQGVKLGTGKAYSVLKEISLGRLKDPTKFQLPGRIRWMPSWARRAKHWWMAERALRKEMKTDPVLRQAVTQARATGKWVWHHHPGRVGVMQLVPAEQHRSGLLKNLFHPKQMGKRRGGFWKWGHLF